MAWLQDEDGATVVVKALAEGAAVSVVNWAEVLSNVAANGEDPAQVAERLLRTEFADVNLRVEEITEADCVEIAKLRPVTIAQGLSLADRACLTLAARLGVPALTADRMWAEARVDVEVRLIR
jgi:PIN domain nuclease of toxin-antitoxin system